MKLKENLEILISLVSIGKIVKLPRKVTKEWFRMKKIDIDQEQT